MERVARTVKRSINEANRQHLNLHGDFEITQDSNTALSYKSYLNTIFKKKQLTIDDELKLSEIILTSDNEQEVQKAKDTLVTHNLPFVISVVNKYKNSSIPKEDLVLIGNEGMIEAVDNFAPDPNNPVRFSSYAVWYIRRNIIDALDKYAGAVKKTGNAGFILRAVKNIKQRYEAENGYEPDINDLYKELKKNPRFASISKKTLIQALDSDKYSTSLDSTVGNDESGTTIGDTIESKIYSSPGTSLDNEDLENELEAALNRVLGKRDANIVCNKYGIGGRREMNTWELADMTDMTEVRINQILRDAYKKMGKDKETRELLQYLK